MDQKQLDAFYTELKSKLAENDDLIMPDEGKLPDVHTLLDNTDPKKIYLSSDWHFFKNHYKKEANYVNTQNILTWCRQNIQSDNIFIYLGDISFRYANEKDKAESQRLMASIPGIKILIIGNHDMMLGQDYFAGCGFDYVYERLDWQNIIFTHKPINMDLAPENFYNIHGHMHKWIEYNTTDGKRNINVYPWFYNNKPITLDYCLRHKDKLTKNNKRSNWTQIGESTAIFEIKRSELPDSSFGIPEDRKFPLDSKEHVQSAIKLFGHAEESKKKALAERIKNAANKYDISIPETTQVNRYLSEAIQSYYNESSVDKIDIPVEVENIVFDMGSVLVDADTLSSIKSKEDIPIEYAQEIYDLITKKLFYEKDNINISWYNIDQTKKLFKSIAPDHIKPLTDSIFETFLPAMYKFSYTDDLINAFKSKGYKIYYLSNWDLYSYELEKSFFEPLLEKFDGGLFSFECHMEKPSLSIYKFFTNKYNLDPNRCLFFDDKKENIDAAITCGWNGILFDKSITPLKILKTLFSTSSINISDVNYKNKIPIITEDGLKYVDKSNIKFWFAHEDRYPNISLNKSTYSKTIDYAISNSIYDSDFREDYSLYTKRYVFAVDTDNNLICVGNVIVFRDGSWDWSIQYPFIMDKDGYMKDLTKGKINEWSMGACNPVIGITKPFILKMCNDSGSIINAKQYALSTDLISDKYLVINENAQLEIVNVSDISNMVVEQYQYIGDMRNLKKIDEAYRTGKIVDNTFFYTALSGKPMLTEDQIDFDPLFKKVDFVSIKENSLTKIATINNSFMEAINEMPISIESTANNHVRRLLSGRDYLILKEDLNGFYIFNKDTKVRSASVEEQNFITEQIINSVL